MLFLTVTSEALSLLDRVGTPRSTLVIREGVL